ncbi:hypothetical protein [Streptomyces liliifuscus]|uniref:Uncharacterized protein n=1 Tax=Streptomyces liliifuscus TaxID=2797636 RepID=A0A7T7L1Z2_9ACTN|nr:hypothetical protein [Streptomyces liliifuscus]QQM44975.1 hypothetical protein JEQ17_39960 [Streptomyces liliifuscus]
MNGRQEQLQAATGAGKDTRNGSQPCAGGSTQPEAPGPVFPHLAYADAVYAALTGEDMRPPLIVAAVSNTVLPTLTIRLSWPAGHPGLREGMWPKGLHVGWSHHLGWRADADPHGDQVRFLPLSTLASPAAVTDMVLHLAEHGMACDWEPDYPCARWEHAGHLDAALAEFEGRGVSW